MGISALKNVVYAGDKTSILTNYGIYGYGGCQVTWGKKFGKDVGILPEQKTVFTLKDGTKVDAGMGVAITGNRLWNSSKRAFYDLGEIKIPSEVMSIHTEVTAGAHTGTLEEVVKAVVQDEENPVTPV